MAEFYSTAGHRPERDLFEYWLLRVHVLNNGYRNYEVVEKNGADKLQIKVKVKQLKVILKKLSI